jgi:hypothetical protein
MAQARRWYKPRSKKTKPVRGRWPVSIPVMLDPSGASKMPVLCNRLALKRFGGDHVPEFVRADGETAKF